MSEVREKVREIERRMEELRAIHDIMEELMAILKFHVQEEVQDE